MRTMFTLRSSEGRRLIAMAVAAMPQVQKAQERGYVILTAGTTNAFIAQELLGKDGVPDRSIRPECSTAGTSSHGVLCVSDPATRGPAATVFHAGKPTELTIAQALQDIHPETVVIKGANALDPQGNVGIATAAFGGGTVSAFLGTVASQGLELIVPVGLEKLIPSVPEACQMLGVQKLDCTMGMSMGMFCLSGATVVTEVEALRILFDVHAVPVAAGGIGGNTGSVTLAAEGETDAVERCLAVIRSRVKGEPPIPGNKRSCTDCRDTKCIYHGCAEPPNWMQE